METIHKMKAERAREKSLQDQAEARKTRALHKKQRKEEKKAAENK